MKSLTETIKDARIQKGLLQHQVASLISARETNYSSYENGTQPIPDVKLFKISQVLELDFTDLLLKKFADKNPEMVPELIENLPAEKREQLLGELEGLNS